MNKVNVYCIQKIGDEDRFPMNIVNVYCIETIGDAGVISYECCKCILYIGDED